MSLLDGLGYVDLPRIGPPSWVAAMAAGYDMVTETDPDGEQVWVLVVDRSGERERVLEWHRCRDLETVGGLLRCRHVNGDGQRCRQSYAAGYAPSHADAWWEYERDPT